MWLQFWARWRRHHVCDTEENIFQDFLENLRFLIVPICCWWINYNQYQYNIFLRDFLEISKKSWKNDIYIVMIFPHFLSICLYWCIFFSAIILSVFLDVWPWLDLSVFYSALLCFRYIDLVPLSDKIERQTPCEWHLFKDSLTVRKNTITIYKIVWKDIFFSILQTR